MRTLLFLLLAARGCDPAKANKPLNDPATAVGDPKLSGHWLGKQGDWALHVTPHSGAQLDIVLIATDDKGAHVLHYQGHATPAKLLSLRAKTFADPLQDAFTLSPKWIFAKYEFAADGSMTLAWLEQATDGKDLANPAAYVTSADAKWQALDATFRRLPADRRDCCQKCSAASRNDPSGVDIATQGCSKYRYDDSCNAFFAEQKTRIGECWKK